MSEPVTPHIQVEPLDESSGTCDCCGDESRSVWGMVHAGEATVAAYWMRWTVGHLQDQGASLDLVIGAWGEETGLQDRTALSLIHLQRADGTPALMIVDGHPRPTLAGSTLIRSDVIGTPLAQQVFAITDAIYEQDNRFF